MYRSLRLVFVLALAAGAAPAAYAATAASIGRTPVERMIDLNRRAFTDIKNQRFQAARYWLEEALVIGETAGLDNDEMTARTHVHLAVVHLTGLNDREEAIKQFTLALKINPNITITAELETPALKSAYLEAREQLGLPPNPDATMAAPSTHENRPPFPATADPQPPRPDPGNGANSSPDPDPPARVPVPLYCQVPFEVPRGKEVLVRCLTQRQQKRASGTLYYRQDGAPDGNFIPLQMSRGPKGWLSALVPASEVRGKSLSYYVKAQIPGSEVALHNGSPDNPTVILVASAGAAEAQELEPLQPPGAYPKGKPSKRRAAGAIWLGLGFGTGAVYHGRTAVDSNTKLLFGSDPVYVESGFSGAGMLQIEPELGFQLSKRVSISAMLRYQYAPKEAGSDAPAAGERAVLTSALAGFARAQVFFDNGGNRLQPYVSFGAGVGNSFLGVIPKRCGPGACGLDHSDTIHGGAVSVLAGVGLLYHVSPAFGVTLDIKEIVTMPKVMGLTELNLGVAVAHDFWTKTAPVVPGRTSPLAAP